MAWNDDESEAVESGALATFSETYSKNLRALEEAPRRRVMSSTTWAISKSSSLGDWLGLGWVRLRDRDRWKVVAEEEDGGLGFGGMGFKEVEEGF
ncbi:hypothetical protein Pyn_03153 [Prunus yedoensis var. nudiflora]|uniref:Uncharacterized protein n=1 Tax=Prunus yedoensis var. nudiflora TaxID=2094558 RepID=A0A314UKN9_PRUYE|nr:hypothetical protein Pyn_03153 [Prunus yedoensis var. nudiflora]